MTENTAQDLSAALASQIARRNSEAVEARIARTKAAFAYFCGEGAADVLTYEVAERGFVKVSTDAATLFAEATSDFDGADSEFFTIKFYSALPTGPLSRWRTRVKMYDAVAALADMDSLADLAAFMSAPKASPTVML